MTGSRVIWLGAGLLLVMTSVTQAQSMPTTDEARDVIDQVVAVENAHEGCITVSMLSMATTRITQQGYSGSVFLTPVHESTPFGNPPRPIDIRDFSGGAVTSNDLAALRPLNALVDAGILRRTRVSANGRRLVRHEFTQEGASHLEGADNQCLRFGDVRVKRISDVGPVRVASSKVTFTTGITDLRAWAQNEEIHALFPGIKDALENQTGQTDIRLEFVNGHWETTRRGPDKTRVTYRSRGDYSEQQSSVIHQLRNLRSRIGMMFDDRPFGVSVILLTLGNLLFLLLGFANRVISGIGHIVVTVAFIVPGVSMMTYVSNRTKVTGMFEGLESIISAVSYGVIIVYIGFGIFVGLRLAAMAFKHRSNHSR